MYLSRVRLLINRLTPAMLHKWGDRQPYAAHQWLWQLFSEQTLSEQTKRPFLFRQEGDACFYVLSQSAPLADHDLFVTETKAYRPQISAGMRLAFQLRANPVIMRRNKRYDVLMDAKYQAKARGEPPSAWGELQEQAAKEWLTRQGEQHGFELAPPLSGWQGRQPHCCLLAYQQHRVTRRENERPICFSSADYVGSLVVTNEEQFLQALFHGVGKSKSLGCGLLLVKREG